MKSKDRYINDVFIDYFLQSLKYESVYLCAWDIGSDANAAIDPWITFYNHWRPHAGQLPHVVCFNGIEADQQT